MKLTYRGRSYKAQKEVKTNLSENKIVLEQHLKSSTEENKVIQIKPIHYYTYRGISYTKNLFFDSHSKLLLDIERK